MSIEEGEAICQVLQVWFLVAIGPVLGAPHQLGHILVDLTKIKTVMQLEVPKSAFEIQSFLGLASYY